MTKYKRAQISIIAAIDENRGIGKDNSLLWHIPEDLKRFKELTTGHPIIMGRKTYESIGKLLPGRVNIIVTRNKKYKASGCLLSNSLKSAINKAREKEKTEIFIIGGGEIYRQAIKLADKLYLTSVKGKYDADTLFPDYSEFSKVLYKRKGKSGKYLYEFLELARK